MNKSVEYRFELTAEAPITFGSSEVGEILKNSQNKPIIFGSSIGGALRTYLKTKKEEKDIINYFGGVKSNDFIESKIYISDGKLNTDKIEVNDRTKVNYEYGVAEKGSKYSLEYLPEGIKLQIYIRCDFTKQEMDDEKDIDFEEIILSIAEGFDSGELLLGGQKTNGYGKFRVDDIKEHIFDFDTPDKLDEYIFNSGNRDFSSIINTKDKSINTKNKMTISMDGCFLYGVYQNYNMNTKYTGIKDNYIFGSSLKGIFRSEIEVLIKKFISNNEIKAKQKIDQMFGGTATIGQVIFQGLKINELQEVKIERCIEKENDDKPVYIKIDRITGGAIKNNLKKQREVHGSGTIKVILPNKDNQYVFPVFYVLRKIGLCEIPIGGRTSIGLGEFSSESIIVDGRKIEIIGEMKEDVKNKLKEYYESFKGWCEND